MSLLVVALAGPASSADPTTDAVLGPVPSPRPAPAGPTEAPGAGVDPGSAAPARLTIALDRSAVLNGEVVTATATLLATGPEPLRVRCARPIDAWADLRNVVEGPRLSWATSDPWRERMRRQLLGDASAGRGPLAVPLSAAGRRRACPDRILELAPGESVSATFPWTVGYGDGSPLYGPDAAPAVIRARANLLPGREPGRADAEAGEDADAPIVGAAPVSVTSARVRRTLPPARAIEALFGDEDAARWLDLEDASTWRRATMRLVRGRWLFEIRRVATGCCRERLTAAIRARDGRLVALDAPTIAWSPARTRLSYFETLELRVELQRVLFKDGRNTRMRITVTNVDDEDSVWFWSHDNDCTDQPGLWIAAGPEARGMRWRGKLGAFKRLALKGELIVAKAGPPVRHQCRQPQPIELAPESSVTTESFFRPSTVPMGQRTLQAVGRIDLVGPQPDTVGVWRVYASPTVRARFRTGKGSQQVLSPSMIIDGALGDRRFARRIKRVPVERWRAAGVTGSSVWLELTDGTRIVGLP